MAMAFMLILGSPWLLADDAPLRENEIKLFISAANVESALKALNLDERKATTRTVCFFDTADASLAARNLILRARQSAGKSGDSTVKIRANEGAVELSEAERAIQPEQDWTHEDKPVLSRSLNRNSLPKGLLKDVTGGITPIRKLFDKAQENLITARIEDLDWNTLKCYGPVETRIWKRQFKFEGFEEPVTVELWQLKKDGKTDQILEVSTKAIAETESQAQALAKQFFAAAKSAGLGEPAALTKTKKVFEFHKTNP